MDGFGYKNWNKGSSLEERSSYDYNSSPPTYNSQESYGFSGKPSGKGGRGAEDVYDFDLSNDFEYADSPVTKPNNKARRNSISFEDNDSFRKATGGVSSTFGNTANSRRLSTDDRVKEILGQYQPPPTSTSDTFASTNNDFSAYKTDWNKFMTDDTSPQISRTMDTTLTPPNPRGKNIKDSTLDSDMSYEQSTPGDSMDFSPSDLEVINNN